VAFTDWGTISEFEPNGTLQYFVNDVAILPREYVQMFFEDQWPVTLALDNVLTIAPGDVLTIKAVDGFVHIIDQTTITLRIFKIADVP
jgi:hypothetical protein